MKPTKGILGFLVDGKAKTVRISNSRAKDIVSEICRILKKRHVQLKRYSQIVGKLRHVGLILPGIKGLFFPINKCEASHQSLAWEKLATSEPPSLTSPTRWSPTWLIDLPVQKSWCQQATITTRAIVTPVGAAGAGSVWISGDLDLHPLVCVSLSWPPSPTK
jgi:hypothetical protein